MIAAAAPGHSAGPLAQGPVHTRYPRLGLAQEVALALFGFGATAALALALPLWWLALVMAGLSLLFAAHGIASIDRAFVRIAADGERLEVTGGLRGRRVLAWGDLERLKVRHYASRRGRRMAGQDGEGPRGWTTVRLEGAGTVILLDSLLPELEAILEHAAAVAQARDLALDEITADNLLALGMRVAPLTMRP